MILFPPAKLNLGLQIIAKRSDGYHNLQTVFYQFPLKDVLEIIEDNSLQSGACVFKSTGLLIPDGENLCVKAYKLLDGVYSLPGVRIYLHKMIPMGAGLGGGSSDAVYALKSLNILFDLKISADKLKEYALILGSDCPLFVDETPQYAEGRGELLNKINVDLKGKYLLLIHPNIHISTSEAFATILPKESNSCKCIVEKDINHWKIDLVNDFESSVFPNYPELADIKEKLYSLGADYAAMSGSGSTMFGIFSNPISHNDWPAHYFVWQSVL